MTNPFKGLQPYSRNEGEKLFGRDRDLILVKDRIFSGRTTLLFAGSGVGKTSFLNAKVIPELENQYCTFYHNRWAGPSKPLDAVKHTLADKIEAAKKDGSLLDIFSQFNDALAPSTTQPSGNGDGIAPRSQCLLIFDQFEEIFQYHAYEDYFKLFLRELCEVIGKEEYRVHVIFSMREEFLGELSVFDNLIPDLFNNYYRLKYPDTREARLIIEGTCELDGTKVDGKNLGQLILDLSKIEKGAAGAAERSTGGKATDHVIERSFIIPPYLQIACYRHWQEQAAKADSAGDDSFIFLEDYQPNQAQKMLRDFCQEKLSALSFMEQNLAAQSFDFLVTKQGAKMAYEFTSLADHMRVRFSKGKLKQALKKLSDDETRILRKSHGPDGSLWFELYHDIYGKILDTWRQSFRQRKQRAAISVGLAMLAVLLILIPVTLKWIVYPRAYRKILREAHLELPEKYIEAKAAFKSLSETFGYQSSANSLWAQAWARRADYAENHNKRDEAIVSWLQALSFEPDGTEANRLRLKVGNLTGGNYRMLKASLHHENKIISTYFSADGRVLVTQSTDHVMRVWDGHTGDQIGKYSSAPSARASAAEEGGEAKPAGTPTAQARPPVSGEGLSTNPITHEEAKTSGGPAQQQYSVRATAFHPKLGWLIAAILMDFPQGLSSRVGVVTTNRIEYHVLSLSILSSGGEIQRLPISTKAKTDYDLITSLKVAFSPDGKYIAVHVPNEPLRVWKLADKTYVPADGFTAAGVFADPVFSPDGRSLLTKHISNARLSIWDVESGKLRYQPISVPGLNDSKFSSDGSSFVARSTSAGKALIQVWDTATGKPVRTPISLDNTNHYFAGLALNSSGRILLSESYDRRVFLADLQSGELQQSFKVQIGAEKTNTYREEGMAVILSPDGEMMLIYKDNEARLLKADVRQPQGKTLKTGDQVIQSTLLKDGKTILTLSVQPPQSKKSTKSPKLFGTKIARLWDAETAAPLGDPISNVIAASSDGEYIARQEQSNGPALIQILSSRTGAEATRFTYPLKDSFNALYAGPGGKFFAIYNYYQDELYLWEQGEISTPVFQGRLSASNGIDITFSPDGRFFGFTSDRTDGIELVNLSTKQTIALSNNLAYASTLSFNMQGQMIAGGPMAARIWDVTSTQHLYSDLDAGAKFIKVALSPDGKVALTGDENGTESLWKFADNGIAKTVGEVKHGESISSVSFSDDGKTGVIMVGGWLHTLNVSNNVYGASYFLDDSLAKCRSLDGAASHFRCLIKLQDDLFKVEDLQSGEITGAAPIDGEPGELLKSWQTQLGLDINPSGLIVPAGASATPSAGE